MPRRQVLVFARLALIRNPVVREASAGLTGVERFLDRLTEALEEAASSSARAKHEKAASDRA
jgi:hypothetical protein